MAGNSKGNIFKRFGYAQGRKVYYVYGAPCSGKSSYVESIKGNSDIIADIDLIWAAITGGQRYVKPDALKVNAFQLYSAVLDQIKTRAGKWERAYIITGGAHKGQRERQLAELGAEPIFIDTPKEVCLQRLKGDTQRDVTQWAGYIDEWFSIYQE